MTTDKVRVAVRVRPMNRREIELSTKTVVDMENNQTILYHPHSVNDGGGGRKQPKTFAFDNCFWSMDEKNPKFADQENVFNCLGKDLLEKAFEGYNGCIFAYGQTGSGKSYTMMGTLEQKGKGLIPRLCDALFEHMTERKSAEISFKVEVSYMEIYNEKVHDLLDPKGSKQNLKVREHNILGPYVDGLSMLAVSSFEDIDNLMSEGNKSRTVAATNMNNESSRSHAVFSIILTQTITDLSSGVSGEKQSKVSLVDLAGSERAQKTGAIGDRLREGSNINKSLTTLGLVISALADASGGGKKKDKFVPYRDSVLTWLLKDNLGGNSKTVMVATVSPAADNYEETLSTLRYADRAKRIVNHAVINEDPNARIIRDLREEVEMLKKQLNEAKTQKEPVLQDRLEESEKLIKTMSKTWEEKVKETEKIHQERHEALEKMGVSVQTSGIKVEETGKHYLVNLNADPSLNELLVYYLKDHTLVGRPDAVDQQDIQLSGLGIHPEHCIVDIDNNDVFLTPLEGARTCVNGSIIQQKTRVKHGDRILWGNNHFFRINCPKLNSPSNSTEPEQKIDYDFAQQEFMMKEYSDDPIQEAIIGLEKQYEEDKQVALEKQKQEYEHQMQMLRNQISSPGTPSTQYLNFTSPSTPQSTIQRKYQKWAQERDMNFKQSLQHLRAEVLRANKLVREANDLAKEMGKKTDFQVTLQIPASNLSPNRRRGAFVSEPAILVKRKHRGNQIWSMEKFENKIIDMRDLYEERKSQGLPLMVEEPDPDSDSWDEGSYVMKGDPFYESQENHNLIGVANIFLECLFHDVKLSYHVPIISQQGEIAGKLHIEISRLGGSFLDRFADTNCEDEDDSYNVQSGAPMIVRICIREAKGLPSSMSNFVFCQYTFWGHEDDAVVVPPNINPETSERSKSNSNDTLAVYFKHSKDFKVYTTDEFIEHCQDGALSVEVWGHKITTSGNPETDIVKTVNAKTKSLSDRWSEVMRKIELWTEIHELNHQGEWSAVDVQPKPEVHSAGVFQLQQGHSRRLMVQVKPVIDSGTLPLICDSITSVCVGCIYSRQKIQKGLDSYQEGDLTHLRERWSDALAKRKEYLHEQIQRLINKQDKSEADCDRERALMDQWVCLTEERNAVMVPSPRSGIPGAPAVQQTLPHMEMHMPVLFLDLNADDMSTPSAREGHQAAGMKSILPKEHASTFVNLPITKTFADKDSICAIASWDSTMHDSVHLNRVTPNSDHVYLILKATVRLSHPASMELVLRKRLCINIYTSMSFTNLAGKIRQKISGTEKFHASGVTYDVVSNIPKASEDLENLESLAQMAALQNETSADDGETYIEKYIKGVSGVESILTLDRLRQEVAVKELTALQGRSLRKATSTPNIHQGAWSPLRESQHMRADSIQDLSHDLSMSPSRLTSAARPNFLNLGSLSVTQPLARSAMSPHGIKPPIKHLGTLMEEQFRREEKPLLTKDEEDDEEEDMSEEMAYQTTKTDTSPMSNCSDEFQDFESYQSQQTQPDPQTAITTSDVGIIHSNTSDSLIEAQCKNFTPSLVSSGYGSQAVSMLTLSSEDSLSLRSVDENSESHKDNLVNKKMLEQTSSSSSDSDLEEGKVREVLNEQESHLDIDNLNDSSVQASAGSAITEKDLEHIYREGVDTINSSVDNKNISVNNDIQLRTDDCVTSSVNQDSKSSETVPVIHSERLRKSKEERQRILASLGAQPDEKENRTIVKPNDSERAGAIVDHVDPYSETAMEQLECLSLDEDDDYVDEDHSVDKGKVEVELFISEKDDKQSERMKEDVSSPTSSLEKKKGMRPRPMSCIVSPSQDVTSLLEESMKRNSLTLHLSDEDDSICDDASSTCSFGSRADLERLHEAPLPSWVQIGESVMVNSSRGGAAKTGVVQFVGSVEFAGGSWVGVELDLPEGKNDGSVNGIRYFKCGNRHGIFVRHDKLILDKKRRGSRKQASVKRQSIGVHHTGSNSSVVRSSSSHGNSPNSSLLRPTASSSAKKK